MRSSDGGRKKGLGLELPTEKALSPEVKQSIGKISKFMQNQKIQDLSAVLRTTVADGTVVVELGKFLNFLIAKSVGLKKEDAMELATFFVFVPEAISNRGGKRGNIPSQKFVDIDKIQAAILEFEFSTSERDSATKAQKSRKMAMELVDQIKDLIQDYIINSGGSAFKVFKALDKDGSNFLSQDEIHKGLQNLGATKFTKGDVDKIYGILDDNRDGKVSYYEFLNHLADDSAVYSINDPTHWAFRIFEDLRRKINRQDKGISQLLGVKKGQDQKGIPWSSFKDLFKDLNIHLLAHQEKDLKDFLDCEGQKELVDLSHFQSLVGLHNDQTPFFQDEIKRAKAAPPPKRGKASEKKRRSKEAQRMLIARDIDIHRLRLEFKAGQSFKERPGVLPKKVFCEILDYECDPQQNLDPTYLEDIADEFADKFGDVVNFENFLHSVQSMKGMAVAEAYLFGQLGYMIQNERKKIASEVFRSHFKDTKLKTISEKQFTDFLRGNNIVLSDEEIDLFLLKFDPSGKGLIFDLSELDEEFDNWQKEEFQRNQVSQRKHRYDEFDKYVEKNKKPVKGANQQRDSKPAQKPEEKKGDDKKIIPPESKHTESEKKVFELVKKQVKQKDLIQKLKQQLKQRDKDYSQFLSLKEISAALTAVDLKLSGMQTDDLCSYLPKRAKDGAYDYEELLRLIDPHETSKPPDLDKSAKAPLRVRDPFSATMGDIGEKLLQAKNYEKQFVDFVGSAGKPMISERQVATVMKNLMVRLSAGEQREFEAYFKKAANKSGEIALGELFKAFGLPEPALSRPASRASMGRGQKDTRAMLAPQELKDCHTLVQKIKKGYASKKKDAKTIFEGKKKSKSDTTLTKDIFMSTIQKDLGSDFVKKYSLSSKIDLLVLYLAGENAKVIEFKRLNQALAADEKSKPLKQFTNDAQDSESEEEERKGDRDMKGGNEVYQLARFLESQFMGVRNIFGQNVGDKDTITVEQFKDALKRSGYEPDNMQQLLDELDFQEDSRGATVAVLPLKKELKKGQSKSKAKSETFQNRLNQFNPRVKSHIEAIQAFMKKEGYSSDKLHSILESSGSGKVMKQEFVRNMMKFRIQGLTSADLGLVFDAIDLSGDGNLTVDEFGQFLKGAEKNRQRKLDNLDQDFVSAMSDQLTDVFGIFDDDGNGRLSISELYRTFLSIGIKRTIEQCRQIVREHGTESEGLTLTQFKDVMIPFMKEEMLCQGDSTEDLRAKFLEADTDYSGFLSVDELCRIFRSMEPTITNEEVIRMLKDVEIQQDGQLDIDEFISLMSLGDQIPFATQQNKTTYMKIQAARRTDPKEFILTFKSMPTNFVPSFTDERWTKQRANLPSSVFRAQVDPKTLLWKDTRRGLNTGANTGNTRQNFQPAVMPMSTAQGGLMILKGATGVPLPQVSEKSTFKDEDIVKRAVRFALEYDNGEFKEIVHNVIQVPAERHRDGEDIWNLELNQQADLRQILFRSTDDSRDFEKQYRILIELVVYVQSGSEGHRKVTEMCCGWTELPVKSFIRKQTLELVIFGGSPTSQLEIEKATLRTQRQGFKAFQKTFAGVKSIIEVDIIPFQVLAEDVQKHLELMPSTCFVHKTLLPFVSGFQNYKGKKLIDESGGGGFRKPAGDVIISCFPMIFDNPDVTEELAKVWTEDIQPLIQRNRQFDIAFIQDHMKQFVSRLYPVLYSDEFKGIEYTGTTKSAAGEKKLLEKRKKLVESALRFAPTGYKPQTEIKEKPSDLTAFKPFSVRELEYNIWDTTKSKHDKFLTRLEGKAFDSDPQYYKHVKFGAA